jgi:ribonuclease J
MAQDKLRIIPLGGLGEFGMNCTALRWQDEIIVIDAGLMFPEEELLGVDIVVPDISYLTENREKVRGIILTHGHEDHIGGLPWILSELNVPVYGTEFTLALVEGKLDEHHLLDDAELIEILPGRRFTLGPFSIMPIRVTHSLVDCVALAIHTPVGVVVHSGDFKIDLSSPDGKPFDLHAFAELGKQGVLCLLQDSTNVDRPGYTPSERAVRPRLDEIFAQTKKKLFFSCFSSSIHRIRIAMELADAHGRKVAVIGRSLDNSTEIAQDLGYLDLPPGLVINPGQLRDMPVQQSAGDDLGHAGRADVGALARRGEQPQVRAHRRGRHDGAQLAHHPRQREVDLPHDRPPGTARGKGDLRRRHTGPDPRQRARIAGGDAPDDQPDAAAGSSCPCTATIAT